MAVLGRLKIAANQRLDLPDIEAFDSFSAGDWQNFLLGLTGGRPYILQGFEVFQPNALIGNPAGSVDITLDSAMVWWPNGVEGSFFSSLPGATNRSVTLITSATNYIEAVFALTSTAQDARALWDPGANGGAGGEFSQVVDTEYALDVTIRRNNTGFSSSAFPIAKVVVDSSNNVVSVTDCRNLLFRLGSGGNSPDPLNSFDWLDDPVGFSRSDTTVTMTSPADSNCFRGADKNIKDMKSWMDAVMTRIKEIDGGSKWFQASGSSGGSGGSLSLANLFLDSSAGHSPVPSRSVRFGWSLANDGMFRSINATGSTVPVSWKANFGQLVWTLGGSFVSVTNRSYASYTFSHSVADGQNLYLHLQRDVALNSDPSVTFQNINGATASVSSAATGSFSDIAVGDFIKKQSGSTFQYYKVVELRVNVSTPFTNGTVTGTVADGTVQYVIVSTHDGPVTTSTEGYRYFRSSYSSADVVASRYGFYDTSYYWIGARTGSMFYLRFYGDMQPGEEAEVLDDSDKARSGGGDHIWFDRAPGSIYSPSNGYSLTPPGAGNLLTIYRRVSDNEVGNPSNVDNSNAVLSYSLNDPGSGLGAMTDGYGLWVRLGSTGGTLSAGSVTGTTDNVYEILPPSSNPLHNYENSNVFLVARKLTFSGTEYLLFTDVFAMSGDGDWVNNSQSIQQDLFLKSKTQWSIPFIGTTGGRVDENNSQLFWNNTAGPDALGQLGVRNFRFSSDTVGNFDEITQLTPRDVHAWPNLGAHTLMIGGSSSTVIIPGDLTVQGTEIITSTSNTVISDKHLELGVGNGLFGGGHSGIRVADNTLNATQLQTYSGFSYVDITWASNPGYVTGQEVGILTANAYDGITSSDISAVYTVTVGGSPAAGEMQRLNTTTFRVYTTGTASASNVHSLSPGDVESFDLLSEVHLSGSDADQTFMTSWAFQVKSTTVAGGSIHAVVTPYESSPGAGDFLTIPKGKQSNFSRTRIPFAWEDGVGPLSSDTTFDFTNRLTWDYGTNTLLVHGSSHLRGDVTSVDDDTWGIGTSAIRWNSLHIGSGSVTVHNDATNTLKVTLGFSGVTADLRTDAATALQVTTGSNPGFTIDTAGRVGLFNTTLASTAFNITQLAVNTSGTTQFGVQVSTLLSGSSGCSNLCAVGQVSTNAIADARNLHVQNMVLVSGASITNHYGIKIDSLTSGTNNFAIYSDHANGTGKWFLYGNGSAKSYLAGSLSLGNSTEASINTQRLLLGSTADTTVAGGMNFGTDVPLFRSATTTLSLGAHFFPQTSATWDLGSDSFKWRNLFLSGSLSAGGGVFLNVGPVKTSNYTATTADNVIRVNTSAGSVTINLPSSVAGTKGLWLVIKDVGGFITQLGKHITVSPNGTDTIDGVNASFVIDFNPGSALEFVSDGSGGWMVW